MKLYLFIKIFLAITGAGKTLVLADAIEQIRAMTNNTAGCAVVVKRKGGSRTDF